MIVRSLCNTCFQPYELLLEASDLDLIKQVADEQGHTAPCPRLCGGRINLVGETNIGAMAGMLKQPLHISGKQLYQAVNGLGLPDELPQSKIGLESLLKANKVVDVVLEEWGGRFYLHELKLENGLVFHLASGAKGAQVLKVTQERTDGTGNHS